jgi:transposase
MEAYSEDLTAYCVDSDPPTPCIYEWLSKPFFHTLHTHPAMRVNHTETCCQKKDSRSRTTAAHEQERGSARAFGVSLSSVKRYTKAVREGRSLSPGKAPGKRPTLDEKARRLLEAHVEERPFAKLSERREYLKKVAGVSVSESTLSRTVRSMCFGRKKGRWVRVSAMSS